MNASLPHWPRLLSADLAAAYLGIGVTTLTDKGPAAKAIGRRKLYDRHDLDRWADRLDGQPVADGDGESESMRAERNFRERRAQRP